MTPRIAVLVDRKEDWHARQLRAAFRRRGADPVLLSLAACGFSLDSASGLDLPGFAGALPAAALVKTIAAGTFEQVTMRLGVLHALARAGVPVANDARAIERCVDKSMTSFLLHRACLPTPPTWTIEEPAAAAALVEREAKPGRPLVLKPLFGSQGRGLQLVETAADLPPPAAVDGVYYLQRYVADTANGWRDWRGFLIHRKAGGAGVPPRRRRRAHPPPGARPRGGGAARARPAPPPGPPA